MLGTRRTGNMMTTKPKKSLRGAFPVVHGNLFAPNAINGAIAPIVVGNFTTPCLVVRKTSTTPPLSSEALSLLQHSDPFVATMRSPHCDLGIFGGECVIHASNFLRLTLCHCGPAVHVHLQGAIQ